MDFALNRACPLPTVEVSSFDPRLYFAYRELGSAAGAFATHIDDILGRGECDLLAKVRGSMGKRFGEMEVQEGSRVHVGMELAQGSDFSVTLTRAVFPKNVKLVPTSPELWAGREEPP